MVWPGPKYRWSFRFGTSRLVGFGVMGKVGKLAVSLVGSIGATATTRLPFGPASPAAEFLERSRLQEKEDEDFPDTLADRGTLTAILASVAPAASLNRAPEPCTPTSFPSLRPPRGCTRVWYRQRISQNGRNIKSVGQGSSDTGASKDNGFGDPGLTGE
ncbi:hypothetical protein HJFPF1_10195 [Paramyrothecium foliicola]|nr:hypothetical protein HJFPF1_10195 [Paramyrothecium foliicola]